MKDLYELAKQFVCMIIAASLSLTVSVVESMLSRRPEWLEKVALLETQMRALSNGADAGSDGNARGTPGSPNPPSATGPAGDLPVDLQGLVDGYSKLLEFTQYVKIRGLMLDPEFCERVEREWTVKTAEKSLKEQASEAHDQAAALLSTRNGGA